MQHKPPFVAAAVAATLSALLLTGSSTIPAFTASPEAKRVSAEGAKLYASGDFSQARQLFLRAAAIAEPARDTHSSAMNWNNAGVCSLLEWQFRSANQAFVKARAIAESSHDAMALALTLINIASLNIHMDEPEQAMIAAKTGLLGPARRPDVNRMYGPKLRIQLAIALVMAHRYEEGLPIYKEAIAGLVAQKAYTEAARALSSLADESLKVDRMPEAEAALTQGLSLVREHKADARASILSALGKLRARQSRPEEAATLFEQALAAPGATPKWKLYLDRGQFRLGRADLPGALSDFRDARGIATRLRLDIVPADRDRVGFESGLSDVLEGLVEAGNRLALQSHDPTTLQQTFDAAEQDRQWSLRALLPAADDWRSRLPESYWDSLLRYQSLERAAVARPSPEAESKVAIADDELKRMEAQAGQNSASLNAESPLAHVRKLIAPDAVLFSFRLAAGSCWLWATDRQGTEVFRLPAYKEIEREAAAFRKSMDPASARALYQTLFSAVPQRFTRRPRWLIEPDGPLHETPFAALVVNAPGSEPAYLIEKATLQLLPGALLLSDAFPSISGELLAVGDPIYNAADPRYTHSGSRADSSLPRLPNTAEELLACSRAWGANRTRLLTGRDATAERVRASLAGNPAIVHFATHVVASPREFRTGLIALSLDSTGAMGVLGPREIVARPIRSPLIIVDGCHSTQAEALRGAGLMGLTRAWIAAGASAVLATQWEIPDEDSQSVMASFFRFLAARPSSGIAAALREAQVARLNAPGGRANPARWAAYSLESRIQ